MSGELQDPAALSPEEKTPVCTEQVDRWFVVLAETIGEQTNLSRDVSRAFCSGTDGTRAFTPRGLILSAKGFGDFKMGGQVIRPVKYADDVVLLAEEETVLQGMTDRVTAVGLEMNVDKN